VTSEGLADGFAGVDVPQPDRGVVVRGGEPVPFGTESHAVDRNAVSDKGLPDELARSIL